MIVAISLVSVVWMNVSSKHVLSGHQKVEIVYEGI